MGREPPGRGAPILEGVRVKGAADAARADAFPFSVPAFAGLRRVSFEGPVTIFAGENGSGKSTLLEAMAISSGLPTVGAVDARSDETLSGPRRLAKRLALEWRRRAHRGFFLRAEDFFGFVHRVEALKDELEARLDEVDREYRDRSPLARTLARGPAAGSLAELKSRYGESLDAQSHGESFLHLFRSRFVPKGLYLLDEPEAALSPIGQLGFVAMLKDMVDEGGQFVVATHSPILTAVPQATIYSFDASPLASVAYDDLESVKLLRGFLEAPDRYMRRLWSD